MDEIYIYNLVYRLEELLWGKNIPHVFNKYYWEPTMPQALVSLITDTSMYETDSNPDPWIAYY